MVLSTPEKIRTLQRKLYTKAKQEPDADNGALVIGACLGVKNIGKAYTGKPYARFDEGG